MGSVETKVKEELILNAKGYYESIRKLFEYKLKNEWKFNLTISFTVISFIFFFLNIVGILYPLSNKLLSKLVNGSIFGMEILQQSGAISYATGFGFSLIIFLFFYFINKGVKKVRDKKSIDDDKVPFCLLQSATDELNNYLLNSMDSHLKLALKNIWKYYEESEASYFIKVNDKSDTVMLFDIIPKLQKERFWFKIDKETQLVLDSQKEFKSKILKRIEHEKEIDKVIEIVQCFLIYEYTKIRKAKEEVLKSTTQTVNEIGKVFWFEAANLINRMETLQVVYENKNSKESLSFIIRIYRGLNSLFISRNVLVLFFSWLVLISLILGGISYECIRYFQLNVDSTITIGIATTPIILAVTITAALYHKSEKQA